jgi:hypothetical protein
MTLKKTLKKLFSLPTLKKITLYFLLFSIGSVSIIFLTLHQPWRYLKIADPNDIILPKNPSKSPWIFIIEAPKLNLKDYKQELDPNLPPLYVKLPENLPQEVINYLEKRNSYIREFQQRGIKAEKDESILEILPFQYQDKEGFVLATFVLATSGTMHNAKLHLYDQSFKQIISDTTSALRGFVLSVNFPDRIWYKYSQGGATGGCLYFDTFRYTDNQPSSNPKCIGCSYDFETDPYNTMKIINAHTNPELKTHIMRPYDLAEFTAYGNHIIPDFVEKVVAHYLAVMFFIAFFSIPLVIQFSLILLIVWLARSRK